MSWFKQAGRRLGKSKIVKSALHIALGTISILNPVNQSGALVSGPDISWRHAALNYLVSCCVASCSAARYELASQGHL